MTFEKIYYYQDNKDVRLEVFLCDNSESYNLKKRPTVLICPGGGYEYCSAREAEPVARAYMGKGFNTAVLYYSTKKNTDVLYDGEADVSKPHLEVAKAILTLREKADEWSIDKNKIIVVGFSAGGHLAGCASVLYKDEKLLRALGCSSEDIRPDAAILGYPVINSDVWAHGGSFNNLLGEYKNEERLKRYSIEKHIDCDTPQIFLFHTSKDEGVPVQNSLLVASELAKNDVRFELHVCPRGHHGMSVATEEVLPERDEYYGRWVEWTYDWIKNILNF